MATLAAVPWNSQKTASERERLYAHAALDGCADELAQAPNGERNDTLNKKAFRLGTMVARGWISLPRCLTRYSLPPTHAVSTPTTARKPTRKTMKSGLETARNVRTRI